jgi:hypothetical protein
VHHVIKEENHHYYNNVGSWAAIPLPSEELNTLYRDIPMEEPLEA